LEAGMAKPDPKASYDVIIMAAAAWPVDRLLSRQGTRHHQCRGAGKGLADPAMSAATPAVRSNYLLPANTRSTNIR
jgi:hypothetical protein